VTPNGTQVGDIGISNGRIAEIGNLSAARAASTISAKGLHVLPGVMDTQVHFREPGNTHKEDLETGSRAAVLGGVTAVFEMPNTAPPTTDLAALNDKLTRAKGRMFCDHAFYVGATPDNARSLRDLEREPGCSGVKMFMGSSTGTLLVPDDEHVRMVLENGSRRMAVHSEDEFRLRERKALALRGDPRSHPVWRDEQVALSATQRLITLAKAAKRRVHVLHVSTAEEAKLLVDHKDIATVETTPNHLTLIAPECYERLGTYAQMNPPVRDARHHAALWKAVAAGVVDVIGSDHAPHTREEKDKVYPDTPSGMPGVQTLVPLMLNHIAEGRLTLERFVELTAHTPERIFGLVGKGRIATDYDADLTIVDLKARRTIENKWIASRCGWTPYAGMTVTGWPKLTIVRGRIVMREDEIIGTAHGGPIRFAETRKSV
jgi:dihydroorotase